MENDSPEGAVRLRESGVGVTAGGVVLAWSSLVVDPIVSASAVFLGAAVWLVVKPPFGRPGQIAVGMVLVGVIAMIEASRFGLGIDHLLLGFLAMAMGMFDIIAGLTIFKWRRQRRNNDEH